MEMVTFNGDVHGYRTRSRNDFHVTLTRDGGVRNSLFHKGLVLFNSLPRDLKNESSEISFKNKLRQVIKTIVNI